MVAVAAPPRFEEESPPPEEADAFKLALEGYEGPIDVLLQLARDQKVDITKISILALADQYLAFIQHSRKLRIEIAADYLVMAAWLAYLKSRLLIPEPEEIEGAEPTGAEMAAALAFQLQRLQAMRDAGVSLMALPRLGIDIFGRGEPQQVVVVNTNVYAVSLYDLLKAYGEVKGRSTAPMLRIPAPELYSIEDAIHRLGRMLGDLPGWRQLTAFLPSDLGDGLRRRSAVASTFGAALEMVRQGKARLRQDGTFGPIYLQGVRDLQ